MKFEKGALGCRGRIYRADVQHYVGKREDIVLKLVLRPLLRESCPGCEKCGWLLEQINEFVENDRVIGMESIEKGRKYTFRIANICKDWETGIVEDFDIEAVEVRK
jgi:hypothetical protein